MRRVIASSSGSTPSFQVIGAAANLYGLPEIRVVHFEASASLKALDSDRIFDLMIVDMHGNSPADWARLGPLISPLVRQAGLCWSTMRDWKAETG